ncbi:MAG: class II aldolase/adducin family protein [Beggiatoa sp.]|nr:class II aldolase/adducin family protein [Beggiatoa sp.]
MGPRLPEAMTAAAGLREAVVATAHVLKGCGLAEGTSGNVSARSDEGFVITPTGVPYEGLGAEQIVEVGVEGTVAQAQTRRPSSEWRIHRDIYRCRHEIGAIIHTHSPNATALACCRLGIPPFHYMVARAGSTGIPCAPYATFGTQLLSDHVLGAIEGQRACLMANHGVIAVGADLQQALEVAREVEYLAKIYVLALQIGRPVLISAEEMREVQRRFRTYGQGTQGLPD